MFDLDAGWILTVNQSLFRIFKLAGSDDCGLSPSLTEEGAFLAKAFPLLEHDEAGRWRPRPQACLEEVLSTGYGFPVDLSRRMQSLDTVARALNDNNPCRAAIALVQAKFPPLPDERAARRLLDAEKLTKSSAAYLTQPRVPAGAPGAGQWMTGVAGMVSSVTSRSLNWLRALASRAAGPIAIASGVLFPDNETLASNGAVPGHPDLNYRFSEMRLTLIQNDGDGDARLLFSGLPDSDGFYRDQDGTIVGRAVGDSFMLDNAGVSAMNAAQSQNRIGASAASGEASEQPKLCPEPSPDVPGNKSDRAIAYQAQITGLPPGMAVKLNGVTFDGCRTSDGTMLEAKGPGYEFAMTSEDDWQPWYRGVDALKADITKQSIAANGRQVEWHVAESRVADYLKAYAADNDLKNVKIIHTPAVLQ